MKINRSKRMIAFNKVKKVIASCKTHYQLQSADRMIDNYKALYWEDDDVYIRELDLEWLAKNSKLKE